MLDANQVHLIGQHICRVGEGSGLHLYIELCMIICRTGVVPVHDWTC